jgi:hypothetical protein
LSVWLRIPVEMQGIRLLLAFMPIVLDIKSLKIRSLALSLLLIIIN